MGVIKRDLKEFWKSGRKKVKVKGNIAARRFAREMGYKVPEQKKKKKKTKKRKVKYVVVRVK